MIILKRLWNTRFDIDMIRKFSNVTKRVFAARQTTGKPFTLFDKVLYT
ncbi:MULTISPECIES: hypothetical protein [Chryseobacterium]|nr:MULTISPECIES: hypothetical protein [unclassified Chryseobacterium]MDC8105753.1 hypothetical protein [Chryseobacterium sp. B21-037]MDQ1804256.1 hypothetical protein [Chryseobacterium sp. CKR4-1]WBV54964.1 hypothetical protein PFY10_12030 [Chryseobacterium daecheongense]